MFDVLTKGFRSARARLTGKTTITDSDLEEVLRDIRVSLLEADVSLPVVQAFLDRVRQKAVGEVVQVVAKTEGRRLEVTPAEHFVKLCHDELISLMGDARGDLLWEPPGRVTAVMMVGLHGTGKTTTAAKLANFLKGEKKKPMLVAADIYRPAAVDQLKVLGERIGVPVFHRPDMSPPDLCAEAMRQAIAEKRDVVIFDTAGRLTIAEPLMQELTQVQARTRPKNILLVVDAMMGQDSVRMASEFDRRLSLTGVVMTKLDGDARAARPCRSGPSPASRSSSSAWARTSSGSSPSGPRGSPAGSWGSATWWAWSRSSRRSWTRSRPRRTPSNC